MQREGRSYELAAAALLRLPSDTEWRLAHGVIAGFGRAWLTDGDEVWEPTANRFFIAREFHARYAPSLRSLYPRDAAAAAMALNGHWGPWEQAA